MEQYKVRAKLDGEWIYGSYNDIMKFKVDKDTIGRFTGFKDKNDTEIYEGDIVRDRCFNFDTPILTNGTFMAYNVKLLYLYKQGPTTRFDTLWEDGCMIIGNVYDSSVYGCPNLMNDYLTVIKFLEKGEL